MSFDLFHQPIIHTRENSPASEKILSDNKERFNKQCKAVYIYLMEGKPLTTVEALKMGIGDLRRRLKDLKDAGVMITDEVQKTRYKIWFMTASDKIYNSKSFIIK